MIYDIVSTNIKDFEAIKQSNNLQSKYTIPFSMQSNFAKLFEDLEQISGIDISL